MRILYIQQLLVLPDSSGNDRCFHFAKRWRELGHQITFISSGAALPDSLQKKWLKQSLNKVKYEGIDLLLVPVPYSHHMSFPRRIISFLQFYQRVNNIPFNEQSFDLVIAYSAPLTVGELGRKIAQKLHIPFIFEVADVWPDVPIGMGIINHPWLIKWLHKKTNNIYRAANYIFTFSEGMKEQILSHNVPANKVHVVHNGADTERIPFISRKDRKRNIMNVLYLGTIGKANDLTQLVEAAKKVFQLRGSAIQFTIIGSGNDEKRVKQLAGSYQLETINFLPPVSRKEVHQILSEADVGVVCFAAYKVLEANSATKFYDYLASGLPVIINYQSWQAEYLRVYDCGLSAPQNDIEAFSERIIWLADHPERRRLMGENGRKLAETTFDRNNIALRSLQLITSLT